MIQGTGILVHGTADKGRAMLLEVPDSDNFTVMLKQRSKLDINTSVGIMPTSAELKDIDVTYDHPEQGFFIDITDGRLYGQDGTSRKESSVLPGTGGLSEGSVLRLRFCGRPVPRLFGAVQGGDFVELKFLHPIPIAEYNPCVLLFKTSSIQVAVDKPQKRLCTALARMWEDRNFTDAEVTCAGTVFPIHRAVLAAESPVFAAAFSSSMQEGSTCKLEIKDASAETCCSCARRRRPCSATYTQASLTLTLRRTCYRWPTATRSWSWRIDVASRCSRP